jgi:hypothetical protein
MGIVTSLALLAMTYIKPPPNPHQRAMGPLEPPSRLYRDAPLSRDISGTDCEAP